MNLENKIQKYIAVQRLIAPGDKILLGVSGGADSVALLHILCKLRTKIGFQIHVGHINHHLRQAANDDERFVKNLCNSLEIPCSSASVYLKKDKGSLEEEARQARFNALFKIAKKTCANAIALAHHKDDLAETVLLRILRGTGLQGLQAILPKRVMGEYTLIRPLICAGRNEIENYLKEYSIKFRKDSTNEQTHFLRNKIRKQLFPFLEKNYQGNIKHLLNNLAATAGEDYDFLQKHSQKIFSQVKRKNSRPKVRLNLIKLKQQHPAILRMILRNAIKECKGDTLAIELSHLAELKELLLSRSAGAITHLPHGVIVEKTKNDLVFR